MTFTRQQTLHLRASLQEAVVKCSERCLYQAAKWAAELLTSMPDIPAEEQDATPAQPEVDLSILSRNPDPVEAELEAAEVNKYLLAKSFFDCREYDRCAAVFLPDSLLFGVGKAVSDDSEFLSRKGAPGGGRNSTKSNAPVEPPRLSQKALFLALYAKVISGEKRKDEEVELIMGPADNGNTVNKQLRPVGCYLEHYFQAIQTEDGEYAGGQGWLEYLYGMVLAKEKNETKAMEWFLRSVHLFPMNWGCWQEMTTLMTRIEDLNAIAPRMPANIVAYIFHISASLGMYQVGPNLSHSLDQLLSAFPTSAFLLTCNALLAYHSKDFLSAERHFSTVLALHPHRLDSLDDYSNILYVLEQRPKLAFLAHLCSTIDKFRPESCVVVGNYYSLLSIHEKAVMYFRRALTLDRSFQSAWTLMGHEYLELKNTHAAIESYRRAVDVNRRDYRAWYGLGQTYEMLEMHTYALWYFKKAAGLRPWDGKMWMAVGSCLQRMSRYQDGIKALKRALLADSYYNSTSSSFGSVTAQDRASGHMDPDVLLQIATMFDHLEEKEQAKAYMELCVAQEDGGHGGGGVASLNDSIAIHQDSPGSDDGDGDDGPPPATQEGTGVTAATSRARMWLAKHAFESGEFALASRLAGELCQDGVEVEEAKALMRHAKAQLDQSGGGGRLVS